MNCGMTLNKPTTDLCLVRQVSTRSLLMAFIVFYTSNNLLEQTTCPEMVITSVKNVVIISQSVPPIVYNFENSFQEVSNALM